MLGGLCNVDPDGAESANTDQTALEAFVWNLLPDPFPLVSIKLKSVAFPGHQVTEDIFTHEGSEDVFDTAEDVIGARGRVEQRLDARKCRLDPKKAFRPVYHRLYPFRLPDEDGAALYVIEGFNGGIDGLDFQAR